MLDNRAKFVYTMSMDRIYSDSLFNKNHFLTLSVRPCPRHDPGRWGHKMVF